MEVLDLPDDDYESGINDDKSNKKDDQNKDKTVVRKTISRVTLNSDKICGERGIAQLPKIFSEVKFKGKGYEKQDLDKLLKTMEHWSHRLFPKMMYDDIVEKIEVLGTKRPVQTTLRKIRLGMPLLSSDFVDDGNDEAKTNEPHNIEVVDDDLFDAIFENELGLSTDYQKNVTVSLQNKTLPETNFSSMNNDEWLNEDEILEMMDQN